MQRLWGGKVRRVDRYLVVPAAYVVLRRDDGHVLLLLRQGTGWMDGYWAVPAGHVELGEPVHDAALREAREEAGVTIDPADLEPLCVMHRSMRTGYPIDERVDFFFAASRWSGEPRLMEPDKAAGLDWYPLDKLPDPVVPHERLVLDALRTGSLPTIVAYGFD
jgi:8-oxo-dGTP diphosphatase